MILLIFLEFLAFPNRNDAILKKAKDTGLNINVKSSGSLGVYHKGKCIPTYPNNTLNDMEKLEWCSNIGYASEKPWISFSVQNMLFKITGYSVRNGCCWYACCCDAQSGQVVDYRCCCRLYSFSLQGSNNNRDWETLHSIVHDKNIWGCKTLTFDLPNVANSYRYIRLVQDEEYPNCPLCMQINQIEFYGSLVTSNSFVEDNNDFEEGDEIVSIIGKVRQIN